MKWCERRDSNSHGSPRWNLNPVRLPIPPLSQIRLDYQSIIKSCKDLDIIFMSKTIVLHNGVNDGTRTHDNRDHNPGLYQLSYAHHIQLAPPRAGTPGRTRTCYPRLRRPMLYPDELRTLSWSGRRDSNPRHSAPKADALPDCATPRHPSEGQSANNTRAFSLGQ